MKADAARTLQSEGRVWFRKALGDAELDALDRVGALGERPGLRLDLASAGNALAPVNALAVRLIDGARPVRLVAFNKSEATNWSLPWHQDRVIAVRRREDVPGYDNWTRKSGVWHVEPPIALLERMVFARVHLDAATEQNGCMEAALGSHALGRVADAEADVVAMRGDMRRELCVAERGDVLFVKALTLHRSQASQVTENRRALRIDYAAEQLPSPLEWEFST